MNGHPDMQALALWAGGDLEPDIAAELESHLRNCAACRGTVDEIEKAQELLRSAFNEPSEADLARVRRGIAGALEGRRRTARWCWSFGAVAASLMLLFVGLTHRKAPLQTREESPIELPLVTLRMHLMLGIPEVKRMERPSARRSPKEVEPGLRTVDFVPGVDGSSQLRLTTADPNVVIILPRKETTVEQ